MDIGDKVQLSTGGPAMVLTQVNDDWTAEVVWFSGTTLERTVLPLKALVSADDVTHKNDDVIERMINDYCPDSWTTTANLYNYFKDRCACDPDRLWLLCEKKAAKHNASLKAE